MMMRFIVDLRMSHGFARHWMNWCNVSHTLIQAPTTKLHWSFDKLACLSLCCRKFVGCDSENRYLAE
ncbi:hypothetical protein ACVXG7_01770 [Enterobacter hormaechei]